MITLSTYKNFKEITGYELNKYVVSVGDFFSNDMPSIIAFFKGEVNFIDQKKIKELNRLGEECILVLSLFRDFKNALKTVDFWELLDSIEDIRTHIQYSQNISKYLRSSIINGKTKAGYVYDYSMSQYETLEDVAVNELDEDDESWVSIAVDNDLREVDWDIDGGTNLKLVNVNFQSNLVTTMIDNTIGDRIYGKDLKKLLTYEDDDLMVLDYKSTAKQTALILSSLSKGDIPEFRSMGITSEVWKGTNVSRINFPLLKREMAGTFQTDDLFVNFNIKSINYDNGDLSISYEVGTKRGMVIINNVTI